MFRNIQGCSGIYRDIQEYSGTLLSAIDSVFPSTVFPPAAVLTLIPGDK